MQHRLAGFFRAFGPGILFAATAIGVSHLVQATRAGGLYGYGLFWAIVAANLFKYPFFEYGSRYANVTGKNLLKGYHAWSPWILRIYVLAVLGSMFTVTAGVSIVTAALLSKVLGWGGALYELTLLLYTGCLVILLAGRFRALDRFVKMVALVLLVSTLLAFVATLMHPVQMHVNFVPINWLEDAGSVMFIIALMGWMPTAVDLSTWNSLWTEARIRDTGYKPTLKETLLDFRVGYWISALLALVFLFLGARLMYYPMEVFPEGAVGFVDTLMQLYTKNLGSWSYWVILIAAFSIMLSTTITVFDGYGRVLRECTQLLIPRAQKWPVYQMVVVALALGGILLIHYYATRMSVLLDIATGISFVIAPIIAWFNYKVIFANDFPQWAKPGKFLKWLSVLGLIFLGLFTLMFLGWLGFAH
jgi:Mn2+/Fe2+ NRAMP family transporter